MRGGVDGVGRRVLVGQGQESVRQVGAGRGGPGVQVGMLGVLRATHRQRRDHRHEGRREAGRDGRGAAATGNGRRASRARRRSRRASGRGTEASEVEATPGLYGRGSGPVGRSSEPGGRGTGAPAPATDVSGDREGGSVAGGRRTGTPVPMRRIRWSPVRRLGGARRRGRRPSSGASGAGTSARAGPGRVDLEERARPGDDRVGGDLFADGRQTGDRQSLVAPA